MSEREELLYSYLDNSKAALQLLDEQGFRFLNDSLIWQILSYELEHYDNSAEVILHGLSVDDIVEAIRNYFKKVGLPVKDITLDKTVIPEEFYENLLRKANIKFAGEIWTVHKNDADPFPSNPHAHNYSDRLKLHLGTGFLYRKKEQVGRISNKNLVKLRTLITNKIKGLPLPAYTPY
jgi:hypothetical protein